MHADANSDIALRLKEATEAAIRAGSTRYRIAVDAGIDHGTLARFLDKGADIKLSNAAKLAALLQLDLLPRNSKRHK